VQKQKGKYTPDRSSYQQTATTDGKQCILSNVSA